MTKNEKALNTSLKNFDKYLLDECRKGNAFLGGLDEIVRTGAFQKFYITVVNEKKESKTYCHFVFDRCDGISGYFDGEKFIEDMPFYYSEKDL